MSRIIAQTYEIGHELGSGGGGVVYLARHLRLNKLIVLKADKRAITTRPEVLRREVDALKNLSHTYIPQVYDFVVEDGVVYTVMDYIEGHSLDDLLKQGVRFTQAQVVEWACQLLEALVYLHSRPPYGILHSDIKPANIMLTPQGDIRLIDFNIALALGEEGAVRVGYSFGYASPEHYGMDYRGAPPRYLSRSPAETVLSGDLPSRRRTTSRNTNGEEKTILLDVRSDIYSLGATLYHLFTGERPKRDAMEVAPISSEVCSRAVIDIIERAMEPAPERRFQSAADMLRAFESLHQRDPRARRHRRRKVITGIAASLLFLAGGALTFVGQAQLERLQNAYALAEYSANALAEGDVAGAVELALQALPQEKGLFDPPDTAEAQKALTDALGVYDLSDGFKAHGAIELPSAPLKMELSPSGERLAVLYAYEAAVYELESGDCLAALPAVESALADVRFLDENTLVYAGEGALCAYDLENERELWRGAEATTIALSADGSRVAAVYKDAGEAYIYDAADGALLYTLSFDGKGQRITANDRLADPDNDIFALNRDGTLLAATFSDGSARVFDPANPENDLYILDASDYTHFEGGFSGDYFAFSASREGYSTFAIIDTAQAVQTGGFNLQARLITYVNEEGIYLALNQTLVSIHPVTGTQTEVAYTPGAIQSFQFSQEYTLVTTKDGACYIFDRGANLVGQADAEFACDLAVLGGETAVVGNLDEPLLQCLRLENHGDADLFSYDPAYAHDEARVSADGDTVMLFRYDAFRLYDLDSGEVIADVDIPNAAQIYDHQYVRDGDGSRLEVIYYDGTVASYSAEDGSLIGEVKGEEPDETLLEEFYTDNLRIESPFHGVPTAYDRRTGRLVAELERDAYLTYVTEVDGYIITEYISISKETEGERYGLLLNQRCEVLARLPGLCDVWGDTLVFDYASGNLRTSRIYSLQELIALAESL